MMKVNATEKKKAKKEQKMNGRAIILSIMSEEWGPQGESPFGSCSVT